MLQELAARTGAATWVVVSMLFFIGCWIAIAVWLWRARPEDLEAHARLALEGDPPSRDALRRARDGADGHEGQGRHERRPPTSQD